jgi:hypothetical protein
MTKLDNRTISKMDLALEQACRVFPHGGDHERRRYVVQKLKLSARKGNTTFDGLIAVAIAAVDELSKAEKRLGKRRECGLRLPAKGPAP